MVNQVRSLDFLPEIFQTETNKEFLNATLDVLVSQPDLQRVQGFIGKKYGEGVTASNQYVTESTKTRTDYQFDPAVVFLKESTATASDFIDYPGILDALKAANVPIENQERLFSGDLYSWQSFIDLDKISNFSQYYWLPLGPDAITIKQQLDVVNDIVGKKSFTTADGLTLVNGLKINFNESATPADMRYTDYYVEGVGTAIRLVPSSEMLCVETFAGGIYSPWSPGTLVNNSWIDLPEWDAKPFSQKLYVPIQPDYIVIRRDSRDRNAWSRGNRWFHQDVIDATIARNGKLTANKDNVLTRATRPIIEFQPDLTLFNSGKLGAGIVTYIDDYSTDALSTVAGSTTNVKIIRTLTEITGASSVNSNLTVSSVADLQVGQLVVPRITPNASVFPLAKLKSNRSVFEIDSVVGIDIGDTVNFQTSVAGASTGTTYYVAGIGPGTLEIADAGGNIFTPTSDGTVILTISPAAFGGLVYNTPYFISSIDAENKTIILNTQSGRRVTIPKDATGAMTLTTHAIVESLARVVFANDNNIDVRQNMYEITYARLDEKANKIAIMNPIAGVKIEKGSQVYVTEGPGNFNGSAWRFDGDRWIQSQKKVGVNQSPLFDIVDHNSVSLSKKTDSTFSGSRLFGFAPGKGNNDDVLGFPLSYSAGATQGDIKFDVFLNSDTFTHTVSGTTVTDKVSIGFVEYNPTETTTELKNGWVKSAARSRQYQVFKFNISTARSSVLCDVVSALKSEIIWTPVKVYLNGDYISDDNYQIERNLLARTTKITFNTELSAGDLVSVMIISDQVSSNAFYEIPSNLQNNPFNVDLTSLAYGDIINYYSTIFTNSPGVTGIKFGNNNTHNLSDLTSYGTGIVKNSASLVLPAVFLRKPEYNLLNALQHSSDEYSSYKAQLVDLVLASDYSRYQTPSQILDDLIYQITETKNDTEPFFWTDMLVSGSPLITNTYTFAVDTASAVFSVSRVYDFKSANYYGLAVYKNKQVGSRTISTQLVRGLDYTVSETEPGIKIITPIAAGSTIVVKEYNQTFGTYVPSTPTKLGLYKSTIPTVVTDSTYQTVTQFIVGHDGSYNKMYGEIKDGEFTDFRDMVLFEFELRIYNNLKVTADIPMDSNSLFPGQWRKTDYTWEEILPAYSMYFLNWAGKSRVDYRTQRFLRTNKFTFNYSNSANILDGTVVKSGYWRGLYLWFYDTTNPAAAPWEMLGLTNKPAWWDTRYGSAPYTRGNTLMWREISQGFVYNDGNSYVSKKHIRPDLMKVLPVDDSGKLLDPLSTVIGNYDGNTFNRDWAPGDMGPAESAYRRSSTWPFDLLKLLATFKPAEFYNSMADRDLYKYDATQQQMLFNQRYHLSPEKLSVYGNGVAKHSYMNFVVDLINQHGEDGYSKLSTTLKNLDVRLVYKLAGFSDKQYLRFLTENSTPSATSANLLIPDDSFALMLYDNVPVDSIAYSSVIIQKVERGFTVWGNSINHPRFTVTVPVPGPSEKITVGTYTVELSTQVDPLLTAQVAYGTQYYTIQGVCEFLRNYGKQQARQGVSFNQSKNGKTLDWEIMISEFINWGQQDWELGTTLSLNPNATELSLYRSGLVVQPLTLRQQNYVLNQDLYPVRPENMAVVREDENFTVKIIDGSDTIAYTNFSLNSIEHAIIFDNTTLFGDTIYNVQTGLRQNRLIMQGSKTAEWNGYVNASGFILNEADIQQWTTTQKYPKGQIVEYKNMYWSAMELVEPSAEFDYTKWAKSSYDQIKVGLLPNPSTYAFESTLYYDINRANLGADENLLAFGLIGYRPRTYMAAAQLSDITQVNVYNLMIEGKGTVGAVNAFKGTTTLQGALDYSVRENWAIKRGEFGSVLNSNYIEFLLDQSLLTGNPAIIGLGDGTQPVNDVQQTVAVSDASKKGTESYVVDLINYGRTPKNSKILPLFTGTYKQVRGLPTAGYVNIDDTEYQAYSLSDMNLVASNITNLTRGDVIWLANHNGSWDVVTPVSIGTTLGSIINNLDGTITLKFNDVHGLSEDSSILVTDFDTKIDGYYSIKTVVNLTDVIVSSTLNKKYTTITGTGITFKMFSQRVTQASDLADWSHDIPFSEFNTRRVWVDTDNKGDWSVLRNGKSYERALSENAGIAPTIVDGTPNVTLDVADIIGKTFYTLGAISNQFAVPLGMTVEIWKDSVKLPAGNFTIFTNIATKVYVPNPTTLFDGQTLRVVVTNKQDITSQYLITFDSTINKYIDITATVNLANGQKIRFGDNVIPISYRNTTSFVDYIVSGVGTSIQLTPDSKSPEVSGIKNYGRSSVYTTSIGYLVVDGNGNIYRNGSKIPNYIAGNGTNTQMVAFGDYAYCSSPNDSKIISYDFSGKSYSAKYIVQGNRYRVSTLGTTNYTRLGAPSTFTAKAKVKDYTLFVMGYYSTDSNTIPLLGDMLLTHGTRYVSDDAGGTIIKAGTQITEQTHNFISRHTSAKADTEYGSKGMSTIKFNTLSLSDPGISIGFMVTGPGIPDDTTVIAISKNLVTVSNYLIADVSDVSGDYYFYEPMGYNKDGIFVHGTGGAGVYTMSTSNGTHTTAFTIKGQPLIGKEFVAIINADDNSGTGTVTVSYTTIPLVDGQGNTLRTTGPIAVSQDRTWMFTSDESSMRVHVFMLLNGTYKYVNTLANTAASGFGRSIATSIDGSKLIVGAPDETINGLSKAGAAYVYAIASEKFIQNNIIDKKDDPLYHPALNSWVVGAVQTIPSDVAAVYLNSELQPASSYTINGNKITFNKAPTDGSVVTVTYGSLLLQQKLTAEQPHTGALFGNSVATNKYGAEMIVGSPYDLSTVNGVAGVEGAVYRFTNVGQRYATLTATVSNTGSKGILFIDGYKVEYTATTGQALVDAIKNQTQNPVTATANGNTVTITVLNNSTPTPNDIVDVVGKSTVDLQQLNIVPYVQTQVLHDKNLGKVGGFGWAVAMNQETSSTRDSIVVGAPFANSYSETEFDNPDAQHGNDTVFDQGATTFIDSFPSTGAVYQYDYARSEQENAQQPGKYVFGQYADLILEIDDTVDERTLIAASPGFGKRISFNDGAILISSPNWYKDGTGRVISMISSDYTSSWTVEKSELPQVDITKLNTVHLYNSETNETLEYLDYIDYAQGKLLSAVETNLDFVSSTNPANYGTGQVWLSNRVGTTWLDTSNLRVMNSNQADSKGQPLSKYNARYWNKAFPGSTADIYTWVESEVAPLNYSGLGFVTDFTNYNSSVHFNRLTNSLTTLYYFWVKNYNAIPEGKTLSPYTVASYILDPVSSGIPFIAGITQDVIAIYNSGDSINSNTTALHIGYAVGDNNDRTHQDWLLLQDGNEHDFFPGVPTFTTDMPSGLYLKFLTSLMGKDFDINTGLATELSVPDTAIPKLARHGVSFRPRQSMFTDRQIALQNYIEFANKILASTPVTETKSTSLIHSTGTVTGREYDTSNFWRLVDWWATGYSASTKVIVEVPTYNDLLKIGTGNKLTTDANGIIFALTEGLIARVARNSQGLQETYAYSTLNGWVRVGLQSGTILILDTLFTQTSPIPSQEIYYIVRWLNEVIYKDDLAINRNASMMLMFKVIQSSSNQHGNYLPWLNKTSIVDVKHSVRTLLPYKKYQLDSSELVTGYLNETKPFHVYIKEFSYEYGATDTYVGSLTDFDNPAYYNVANGVYEAPRLVQSKAGDSEYLPTSAFWSGASHSNWFDNYGLSITNSAVGQQYTGVLPIATLVEPATSSSAYLTLDSVNGMPISGTVIIGNDTITYSGVDRYRNRIGRDYYGSGTIRVTENHAVGSSVSLVTTPVMVMDGGRDYEAGPTITAYYDKTKYPYGPRSVATFTPTIGDGKLLSVSVADPGSGYPVAPQLRVAPSAKVLAFNVDQVDTVLNQVYITNHGFNDGDNVVYIAGANSVDGLVDYNNYYVKAINANTIAFYETFKDAIDGFTTDAESTDDVFFEPNYPRDSSNSITGPATSGFIPVSIPQGLTHAINPDSKPTPRFITGERVKLKMAIGWSSGWQYANKFNYYYVKLINEDASNGYYTYSLYTDSEFKNLISFTAQTSGANGIGIIDRVQQTDKNRVELSASNNGTVAASARVIAYYGNDQVRGINVAMKFDRLSYTGAVQNWDLNSSSFSSSGWDIHLWSPGKRYFVGDRVIYMGTLYQCIKDTVDVASISSSEERNIEIFYVENWEVVSSNDKTLSAIDRIIGFYEPTSAMSGFSSTDYSQLMTGTTSPYPVVTNPGFDWGKTYAFFPSGVNVDDNIIELKQVGKRLVTYTEVVYGSTPNSISVSPTIQVINTFNSNNEMLLDKINFVSVGAPIEFYGNVISDKISLNTIYYVNSLDSAANTITISHDTGMLTLPTVTPRATKFYSDGNITLDTSLTANYVNATIKLSGIPFGNISNATSYFIKSVNSSNITITDTIGGNAFVFSNANSNSSAMTTAISGVLPQVDANGYTTIRVYNQYSVQADTANNAITLNSGTIKLGSAVGDTTPVKFIGNTTQLTSANLKASTNYIAKYTSAGTRVYPVYSNGVTNTTAIDMTHAVTFTNINLITPDNTISNHYIDVTSNTTITTSNAIGTEYVTGDIVKIVYSEPIKQTADYYYAHKLSNNTMSLHTTVADSTSGANAVSILSNARGILLKPQTVISVIGKIDYLVGDVVPMTFQMSGTSTSFGLENYKRYWTRVVGVGLVAVYESHDDANNDVNRIPLLDQIGGQMITGNRINIDQQVFDPKTNQFNTVTTTVNYEQLDSVIVNDNTIDTTQIDLQGAPFDSGYGPEELVPGVVTDGINITVKTRPGATWNAAATVPGVYNQYTNMLIKYGHTGFGMTNFDNRSAHTFTNENGKVYNGSNGYISIGLLDPVLNVYKQQVVNPASLEVYEVVGTNRTRLVKDHYTVDFRNNVVQLLAPKLSSTVDIVVYEFGGANQIIRGTSNQYPLRKIVDVNGTHSEIFLDVAYGELELPSVTNDWQSFGVYINGAAVKYNDPSKTGWSSTDPMFEVHPQHSYDPKNNSYNRAKIVFTDYYDPATTFVSFAATTNVLGMYTVTDESQLVYKFPMVDQAYDTNKVKVYVNDVAVSSAAVIKSSIATDGQATITFNSGILSVRDVITIRYGTTGLSIPVYDTTHNYPTQHPDAYDFGYETDQSINKQTVNSNTKMSFYVTQITGVTEIAGSAVRVSTADTVFITSQDHHLTDRDYVAISGTGAPDLNGGKYYVKVIDTRTFDLYEDYDLQIPVDLSNPGAFVGSQTAFVQVLVKADKTTPAKITQPYLLDESTKNRMWVSIDGVDITTSGYRIERATTLDPTTGKEVHQGDFLVVVSPPIDPGPPLRRRLTITNVVEVTSVIPTVTPEETSIRTNATWDRLANKPVVPTEFSTSIEVSVEDVIVGGKHTVKGKDYNIPFKQYIIRSLGTTSNKVKNRSGWDVMAGTSGVNYKVGDIITVIQPGTGTGRVSPVDSSLFFTSMYRSVQLSRTFVTDVNSTNGVVTDLTVFDPYTLVDKRTFKDLSTKAMSGYVGYYETTVDGVSSLDIAKMTIVKAGTSTAVNDFRWVATNNSNTVKVIFSSNPGMVTITVYVGNNILVGGEQLQYSDIDIDVNSDTYGKLTGLSHARKTTLSYDIKKYDEVENIQSDNVIGAGHYDTNWYGTNVTANTISSSSNGTYAFNTSNNYDITLIKAGDSISFDSVEVHYMTGNIATQSDTVPGTYSFLASSDAKYVDIGDRISFANSTSNATVTFETETGKLLTSFVVTESYLSGANSALWIVKTKEAAPVKSTGYTAIVDMGKVSEFKIATDPVSVSGITTVTLLEPRTGAAALGGWPIVAADTGATMSYMTQELPLSLGNTVAAQFFKDTKK
jgi:hypothetical protein